MGEVRSRTPWDWPTRRGVLELTFSRTEYVERLERYRRIAAAAECDALVLYGSPADDATVRHLTGFSTWWGQSVAVVAPFGEPILCTTAIAHREPMHSNVQTTWVRDIRPAASEQLAEQAGDQLVDRVVEGLPTTGRVGFADVRAMPAELAEALAARRPALRWIDCSADARQLRCVKTAAELDVMRRLCELTSTALRQALTTVSPHARELDVAAVAHAECLRGGAENVEFCFALSGPRSIFKNARPGVRRPAPGDVFVIDLGATLGGYRSDVSRNCFVGPPSAEARRAADACLTAREAALDVIRPGAAVTTVVRAMRAAVAEHGLAEWDFSLCHGIGMHLVEAPHFDDDNAVLEAGMVFCVEPIVAPPAVGTLCVEEMVAVTAHGYELLTSAPVIPRTVR